MRLELKAAVRSGVGELGRSVTEGVCVAVERVKCTECENMILPNTAVANGGLCAPCAKTPEWLRRERRDYEGKPSSGAWFTPSPEERGAAKQPIELGDSTAVWSLEPEYYKDSEARSVQQVIDLAACQPEGHVFLASNRGGPRVQRDVGGVRVPEPGCRRQPVRQHARESDGAGQRGPASRPGVFVLRVGLLRYPSRFHMPRRSAFAVLSALALGGASASAILVEWLDCGDISYTARGRG